MNDIKVSILCLVYNHEPYLRKCLDGFVNQKCNFEYEVLIHDDASTDNSASIIKEYEEKYPNIIKPIYQKENQHSKGVKISATYLYPRAQGEYLAWCEGDDYWTDENKLQKQIDFLDEHMDFSACVHAATFNNIVENRKASFPRIKQSRRFSLDEIIKGGGQIFSTNSLVLRKKIRDEMPTCFVAKGFGDYQLFIYAAIRGGVWCFNENMSVYNWQTSTSWSRMTFNNLEKRKDHFNEVIRMLGEVDRYYNFMYHDSIDYKVREMEFEIHSLDKNKTAMRQGKYKVFLKAHKIKKIKSFIKKLLPFLPKIADKIKSR